MKIAVASCTYSGAHSLLQVQRHIMDWQLQSDDRWKLFILSDGPWEAREDRLTPNELDLGAQVEFIEFPERRKAWGAFCRKDWLNSIDTEEFDWVFMTCVDDQINPKFVANMLASVERHPDALFHSTELSHHHYGQNPIPLGTYPTINRCDYSSFIIDSKLAKKVGIQHPEEYAADGLFIQECFAEAGFDETKVVINSNILVFKN